MLHRGHGRVAKKLVRIRIDGPRPERVARLHAAEREVGWVTSAADSPRSGMIALAYVLRDFVHSGTELQVKVPAGRATAIVSEIAVPSAV